MEIKRNQSKTNWDTIVIGGGQAGLTTGYQLKQRDEDFIILDAAPRTGASWRNRWNSLRLFTPAWTNDLPGYPFPGPRDAYPTKDEVADFLEGYKDHFQLPVLYDAQVRDVSETATGFEVKTNRETFAAKKIVVATGHYTIPKIPSLAAGLRKEILQIHSSAYKSAADLLPGDVLVVGAGTSGLQIAMDLLSDGRKVTVAGKPPARIPDFVFKYLGHPFVWFADHILTANTPMGRKARHALQAGAAAPLIHISLAEVKKGGATHIQKLSGARDGYPLSTGGEQILPSNIIWCTGFLSDYSWLHLPGAINANGHPHATRGLSAVYHNLYFVGSLFQYGLTSTWLHGVGRDAAFVAHEIKKSSLKPTI